jgi:hypothetical protein
MRVYLVPIGRDRYEPYSEVEDTLVEADERASRGVFRRYWATFTEMLQQAERAQRDRDMADGERSLGGRLSDRLLGWVAERIAEQRLLWHLRRTVSATLVHPSDVTGDRADAILRDQLRREADRHRRWLWIDGLITVITGPLFFFVPGPNLVAYYFAFRAVGHFLSHRGARQGLEAIAWAQEPNDALSELRHAASLDPASRGPRVRDLAGRLQLPHLPTFFERMVLPGA